MRNNYPSILKHYLALLGTVILWGTSFPVIKILVSNVNEYTYVWVRGLLSIIFLTPLILFYISKKYVSKECVKGGLLAGIFYGLGLFFQGWGTSYTTASNSAFITGLNVLFVHLIVASMYKRYSIRLFASLVSGILGLYLLSSPTTIGRLGDFLVLIGAVMWALQIIVFDKYSKCNPFILVYFMFAPTQTFILFDPSPADILETRINVLFGFIYLAIFCSIGAFALQAYGQKKVPPETAATIFLLEPVFASIFAYMFLGETLTFKQLIGASFILLSMYLASKHLLK